MGLSLSFFASVIIGILAGLGVGSGGLYLVYLELFTDTPQREAQGLNLCFFVFALLSAVVYHLLRGTYREKRLLLFLPVGIGGAIVGSLLSGLVPQEVLKTILGFIFLIAGGYTLYGGMHALLERRRGLDKRRKSEYNSKR